MGNKKSNILNRKFTFWKVIQETSIYTKNGFYWVCECECGTIKKVSYNSLMSGKSKSCGCDKLDERKRKELFEKSYVVNSNKCWEWNGNLNKEGYGRINSRLAHRISYEYYIGNIPKNICVCHTCDNRKCVNPAHLFLGTNSDNMKDKIEKDRQLKGSGIGNSKLKEYEISDIKKLLKQGFGCVFISKKYKVSHGLISHIKHGRAWKHIL